jgi:thiosulfate/3-mercaptopyruvate sulfurtransferase
VLNITKYQQLNLVLNVAEVNRLLDKDRSNLLIIDARPFSEYSKGHIPGAVNIELMQFHWIDTSKTGILEFNRQMKILLSNIGIKKDKFVLFYDDISGPSAARGVWLLLYFSHNKVAMLDGGFDRWKKEGYDIETKSNALVHANFQNRPNRKILADFKQIKSAIKNNKKSSAVIIVDSRSKSEYDGSSVRAASAGHIPSAFNIDWNYNIENNVFKDPAQLEKLYCHIPKDAEVITYCQGGYRAANSFVALKMIGYKNVKMYLGSWGEWGNRLDLPAEK